ncbi:U11/U12 small nuclear ribonucleoprotein 48 kDa protein isoform X1 [Solenopsis invicta]|uniref:U11/U12 small nuclear ribonucleoprotein 48 kDa protein isoform X1 n=1 Tax=Solenopsis invicta TaxID=13686 RepID=UPI00193D86A7|nr:U11/U12 small nuclear ribonucleoprotein 48 kDa protein isoform X1 [Solenopsis invicta]XP_025986606.2 U11/U12 small nuclear ribonucleoprotein 48 kDa protein isoform X1 [Solenopsis invicta]
MLTNMNDSREQQLEELKSFIDTVNEEVANIVSTLGWTEESVKNVNKEYFKCPYDSSHWLTEACFNDHLASCQLKAEGYGKLDVWLSEPTLPTDSPFCIKFDKQLQAQVFRVAKEQNPAMQIGMGERLVPRTSDRVVSDFTSDERKALYDYVITNTAKPNIGEDITNINNLEPQQKEDKELSFLEMLIQERNLKRRRAKHKGVHTNKRSHTEILREVINQQMEMYVDYVSGQREYSEEKSHHRSRDQERQESNSGYVIDIQSNETNNLSYDEKHDRTERSNKIFHTSSRNYDDYSGERNFYHHEKKRNNQRREHSEERTYHRSRDQDRQERYLDEIGKKHRHEHRKSSHSRERKSHRKDKHRSKTKHKDKYHEKKHKSRQRDKSSERHYSKHKRKDKSIKY